MTLPDEIKARWADTLVERTSVESQKLTSAIKRMNREVAGRPHTLTAALEARIFGKVELDHDLIRWMIRHSAWLITRLRVRASGHPELIQQRQHGGAIVEYGEFVSAKIPTTESWTSAGSRLCGPERLEIQSQEIQSQEGSDEHVRRPVEEQGDSEPCVANERAAGGGVR